MTGTTVPGLICVSLDSELFTRAWVRYALRHTIEQHGAAEFFLGDRLLFYNMSVHPHRTDGAAQFDFAARRLTRRVQEVTSFLTSEIRRLPESVQQKVAVTDWTVYSDPLFVDVFRRLLMTYSIVKRFRERVESDVEHHFASRTQTPLPDAQKELSRLYILEETAMMIRIAELGCKTHHYYPEEEISTLRAVYNGEFATQGLSVEILTGKGKTRVFTALPLPGCTETPAAD